jgi:hypothetical protein
LDCETYESAIRFQDICACSQARVSLNHGTLMVCQQNVCAFPYHHSLSSICNAGTEG